MSKSKIKNRCLNAVDLIQHPWGRALAGLLLLLGEPRGAMPQTATRFGAGELKLLIAETVSNTLPLFREEQLKPTDLALTIIAFNGSNQFQASHRGEASIYPASVIKLFYLVAAHQWLEEGRLQDSEELRRGLKDMIVDSSNDATHYIVDLLTGTTSGPELEMPALQQWVEKRDVVNRYFSALGYTGINANKKPWCEGPYGREKQAIALFKPNRNALTTDATARLLAQIASRKVVSPDRCDQMLRLLKRDPSSGAGDPDDQAHGFIGQVLPPGAKLWSKAGWTSETRHDAAYIELPNGARLVLVIFTVNHGARRDILPALAKPLIEALNRRGP